MFPKSAQDEFAASLLYITFAAAMLPTCSRLEQRKRSYALRMSNLLKSKVWQKFTPIPKAKPKEV